jgi:SAM-dependent methyltransferase
MDDTEPEPETINRLGSTVHQSFALLAGMQLDVFTPLKEGPLGVEEMADSIGVGPAKLRPLLYALVSAELLTVDNELFSNTDEAQCYLVRDSPSYLGGVHEFWSGIWDAELKTAESIRTGKPQSRWDYSSMSREELEKYFRGTFAGLSELARRWADKYDFSPHKSLLDAGGGSGAMSIAMTEACPGMHATVVELPEVTPYTQAFVNEAGAADRVDVVSADIVQGPLVGNFDVVILSAVLQVLSPDNARAALKNIGTAIKSGGTIFIRGKGILDDTRLTPPEAVVHNLVFVNLYDDGQAYTKREYEDWLLDAGFEDVEYPEDFLIIARRSTS